MIAVLGNLCCDEWDCPRSTTVNLEFHRPEYENIGDVRVESVPGTVEVFKLDYGALVRKGWTRRGNDWFCPEHMK